MTGISTAPYVTTDSCVLCGDRAPVVGHRSGAASIGQCTACGLVMRTPQPSDDRLRAIYGAGYFFGDGDPDLQAAASALKSATAASYLDLVDRYRGRRRGASATLLDVGCGHGDLMAVARARGYQVRGIDVSEDAVRVVQTRLGPGCASSGELADLPVAPRSLDVCTLSDVVEHARDPESLLVQIRELLKPDGTLFLSTPSVGHWSARLMRRHWMEFKEEHLFYFDPQTIQLLLFKAGYDRVVVEANRKILSLDYLCAHFQRFPVPLLTPLLRALQRITPQRWRQRPFAIPTGAITVVATPQARLASHTLSVIVPVYNEHATFDRTMAALLEKQLDGMAIEIVVVESHSTDGTRDDVLKYRDHPRVRTVFEDRPHGKGHAVRSGLRHISGDYVIIQDADLEYDLADYDALLAPLRTWQAAFVLGSRHTVAHGWQFRAFERKAFQSALLNVGHVLFTTLFNVLYGQRLKDPFTMYKVFRRECLDGLHFECSRFDFDCELVGKLVRKGYVPVEIPVSYRSRSFAEGKKVSIWRDPPTWLRAIVKYRFAPLGRQDASERVVDR